MVRPKVRSARSGVEASPGVPVPKTTVHIRHEVSRFLSTPPGLPIASVTPSMTTKSGISCKSVGSSMPEVESVPKSVRSGIAFPASSSSGVSRVSGM